MTIVPGPPRLALPEGARGRAEVPINLPSQNNTMTKKSVLVALLLSTFAFAASAAPHHKHHKHHHHHHHHHHHASH